MTSSPDPLPNARDPPRVSFWDNLRQGGAGPTFFFIDFQTTPDPQFRVFCDGELASWERQVLSVLIREGLLPPNPATWYRYYRVVPGGQLLENSVHLHRLPLSLAPKTLLFARYVPSRDAAQVFLQPPGGKTRDLLMNIRDP